MRTFKIICTLTTLALLAITASDFATDLIAQKKALLDGPLAWASAYAFYLNRFALILFFGLLTLPTYDFGFSRNIRKIFQIIGMICLALSISSFALIAVEQSKMGFPLETFLKAYLYQFAFILVSYFILRNGLGPMKNNDQAMP